jgi:hypothetical protein
LFGPCNANTREDNYDSEDKITNLHRLRRFEASRRPDWKKVPERNG